MQRHDLDVLSLVAGLVCLGVAVAVLFGQADLASAQRWVAPVLLVGLGLGGVLRYAGRSRR